jgi:DNA-binding CsgD family transcriptional regulator
VPRYVLPDGVLQASLHDEKVLLNQQTGLYHLLNPTGVELLRLMGEGHSLDEAADAIADATGMSRARVGSDARSFVGEMTRRGLLVELEAEAT